jgi:uncharacterized protein
MQELKFLVAGLIILLALILFTQSTRKVQTIYQPLILGVENVTTVSLKIPAVDSQGNGVTTTLFVEAKPGSGKLLVDVNQLLFWIDTQYSMQVAKKVAEEYTKADLSKVDLIYRIETNATLIEGPSAGAAISVATIALILHKKLNESVMITGTINPDGSIGPVGGIIEKAKAAKQVGALLFLVPEGQGTQTTYKPIQRCQRIAGWTVCTTEYKKEVTPVSEVGIEVKEVKNVEEALKYFLV